MNKLLSGLDWLLLDHAWIIYAIAGVVTGFFLAGEDLSVASFFVWLLIPVVVAVIIELSYVLWRNKE